MVPIPRTHNPFSRDGVTVDSVNGPEYADLPDSLLALLRSRMEGSPGVEAVAELGGERLTYRQLWDRAARVAGGLRAHGVEHGDRVAIRYPAGISWVLAFWGTLMAGAVVVAVNTRSSVSEVEFVLGDSGTKVDLAPETPLPDAEAYVAEGLGLDDVAALFYTSGTTGTPKGVPVVHRAFLSNAQNMIRTIGIPPDAGAALRTLISVPLFHVTGCNSQMLVAVQVGGTAVIMPALDQVRLIEALATERITFMVTVPAVYALLLRNPAFAGADVSTVRWVGYGGSPIDQSLVGELQTAFRGAEVFNGYGMTETASLMTLLPHADAVEHADSVGYAVPSVDLGLVPLNEADPTVGELVARGANVTDGYWHRPEVTAETTVDGWLHTGDIVRVDDAGRVHIVDRIKDIINRGGENISSFEVESALVASPGVLEAAVLAVPDDVMGEKVGAVVYGGDAGVDVASVIAHCREQLADFKVPQYVAVATEPLPRNAGGKLLKANLRATIGWGNPLR
ncbi:AMP-binding protein [Rhodococcus wratislaviensis]|nr:AMP-binding protein [Rhodococcus sp. 3A]MBC2897393.1 AMP-binding protein [Rhodococcus sp. 4CII]